MGYWLTGEIGDYILRWYLEITSRFGTVIQKFFVYQGKFLNAAFAQ